MKDRYTQTLDLSFSLVPVLEELRIGSHWQYEERWLGRETFTPTTPFTINRVGPCYLGGWDGGMYSMVPWVLIEPYY